MNMSDVRDSDSSRAESDANLVDIHQPIAPDQFDLQYETSKYEVRPYYTYFMGNTGLTLFNFAPTAFQNLVSQAAGEAGVLHFAGR